MFFKRFIKENPYQKLSEKIKTDLICTFQRKGIEVRDIKVDLDYNYMNLKVLITDKYF
jgi:hypothetical protein